VPRPVRANGTNRQRRGRALAIVASKTGTLLAANQRIVEHLDALGALRPGVDALQLCRLVGGVAVVADQGGLDAATVRPLLEVVADGLLAAR
jgi:hypothetical protein